MTQPYLPITCEEFSVVQEDGLVDWPSQKLRILGKLVKETTEKFKQYFFKPQEISRQERKTRIKKFGHLNLEND